MKARSNSSQPHSEITPLVRRPFSSTRRMAHDVDSRGSIMRVPMNLLFHVGQYNILAANLANNLKPWFWYGYRGIKPGTSPPFYLGGDCYDSLRAEVLGYGRSKRLIQAWGVYIEYFKLFDDEYGYRVQDVRHYTMENKEPPSIVLRALMQKAIFEFFHRCDEGNRWGNRKLAHHLFERSSYEYGLLELVVLGPLGYCLEEEQWQELDRRRRQLAGLCGRELTSAMVEYNALLRRYLVLRRRVHHNHYHPHHHHDFDLNDERVEAEFHEVALEMATFVCLSDDDLQRIIEHEEQMDWKVRGTHIIQEIRRMSPNIIGLEEVDRIDTFKDELTPGLRLAVYKHRKVSPNDDGSAIFYDPSMFELVIVQGEGGDGGGSGERPAVASIRFSGEACLRGISGLALTRTWLRYKDGSISAEREDAPGEGDAWASAWAFTPDVSGSSSSSRKSNNRHHDSSSSSSSSTNNGHDALLFDERVAVVAALRHVETGAVIITVCTHLAHSQDAPGPEAVRAFQLKQMEMALVAIRKEWSIEEAPVILMMDGNDTPRLRDYGRGDGYTPMYETALRLGWKDLLGEDYAATSITLNRRFRIDYVMAKAGSPAVCSIETERPPVPALRVRLVGLNPETGEKTLVPPEEEAERAVYGAPLPAVEGQPVVPSDHLHCSVWVKMTWGEGKGVDINEEQA